VDTRPFVADQSAISPFLPLDFGDFLKSSDVETASKLKALSGNMSADVKPLWDNAYRQRLE